jgi:hypothetical protein
MVKVSCDLELPIISNGRFSSEGSEFSVLFFKSVLITSFKSLFV